MIDVIIPAYNAHDTIEETLFSIAYQDMVKSVNVYIVNDDSKKDYKKFVDYFKNFMNIKELKLDKNSGPGVARQYGINNSTSDFIMFIDADDVLANPLAITNLYEGLQDDSDVVVSTFSEEIDSFLYDKERDTIWLHGKIYRRSFLEEKNIHFNDTRHNEDNGFNQLILLCGAKINYINEKTYIWRNNKNSITRKNNREYDFKGISGYIYNIGWALEEADKRGVKKVFLTVLAYSSLMASYYYYLSYYDMDGVEEFIELATKIKKYYNPSLLTKEQRITIVKSQYNFSVNDKNILKIYDPVITFTEFLNRVEGVKE